MASGLILLILTGLSVMVTYHCFRYKNTFWVYPNVAGFKDRKKPDTNQAYIGFGIYLGIWSAAIAAITVYYFWQLIEG